MEKLFQDDYLAVMEARTRGDLHDELGRFTRQLGFQTFSAIAVVDHAVGEPEFISVDNTPAAYRDTFLDPSVGKRDPVAQHCKVNNVPIIWDQLTYTRSDRGDMWERQARFGYKVGIALALHMPGGRHFFLALDRDQPLPRDPAEVTRMVSALHLYAVYAQEASSRLLLPTATQPNPSLTPRELETLRWTMEGKTAWEVGRILGIAEDTVIRHAHSASRKLGCSGKHHAVVKALRLGLIR